jgi:nucleotide-binding universal stress UspA family protein
MKTTTKSAGQGEVLGRVQRSYPRLRRILVPLDFSGKSRRALRYAAPVAARFGARVVLLHVLERNAAAKKSGGTLAARRLAAHKRLRETALQFLPEEQIDHTVVREGEPAREIIEAARVLHTDLLTLAVESSARLGRLFKGSTARRVLRLAPCPVLTVRKA